MLAQLKDAEAEIRRLNKVISGAVDETARDDFSNAALQQLGAQLDVRRLMPHVVQLCQDVQRLLSALPAVFIPQLHSSGRNAHHYRLERAFRFAILSHKADVVGTPLDEKAAAAVITAVSKRAKADGPFDMPAFEKFDVDGTTGVERTRRVRASCLCVNANSLSFVVAAACRANNVRDPGCTGPSRAANVS